jgi:uncharacterized protein
MYAITHNSLFQNIRNLVMQPNYPCVSAVSSFLKKDYMTESYPAFGSGQGAAKLYADLIRFKNEQRRTKAPFYSFWAVYDNSEVTSEEDFEQKLWSELSAVHAYEVNKCAEENTEMTWDPKFSSNPNDKNFCFCVDGHAYFLVGMHPLSSRKARQFPYPVLIFNLYAQFDELFQKKTFEPMVKINRLKEIKFQGDINPMVEKHGQEWESIQFSGKNNSDQWKCPFQKFFHKVMG